MAFFPSPSVAAPVVVHATGSGAGAFVCELRKRQRVVREDKSMPADKQISCRDARIEFFRATTGNETADHDMFVVDLHRIFCPPVMTGRRMLSRLLGEKVRRKNSRDFFWARSALRYGKKGFRRYRPSSRV